MKVIKLLFLLSVMIICGVDLVMGQITFQKKYGVSSGNKAKSVCQTTDGGYIMAGETISPAPFYDDLCLVKTDSIGDTVWTKYYRGEFLEYCFSVKQIFDGGYILTGFNQVANQNYTNNVCLLKTDSIGNLIWSKSFGGTYHDYGYDVEQTSDSGYVITGSFDDTQVYLIRTDTNGNLTWNKKFNGTNTPSSGRAVKQLYDGGFIIAGFGYFGINIEDVYLIRTDSSGNLIWSKNYGGSGIEIGRDVILTTDGGFLITGSTESFGAGDVDVYVIKTDSLGNVLWSKTFGGAGSDFGASAQQTTDGSYLICGGSESFTGICSVYLNKIDSTGNLMWSKNYGYANFYSGFDAQQTSDNGFIMVSTQAGFYLIKTDSLGNSGCNESIPATITDTASTITGIPATAVNLPATIEFSEPRIVGSAGQITTLCTSVPTEINELKKDPVIRISPNPISGFLIISGSKEFGILAIYDISGQELIRQNTSEGTTLIKTEKLSDGIYFLRYTEEDKTVTLKLIKH